MLIKLPAGWIIALNVVGWLIIQMGLAWAFTQMPARWFAGRSARAGKPGIRRYERLLAIRRWKDFLPDASRWFSGGFAKKELAGKDPAYLAQFIGETRRGELCHWLAICCAPLLMIWTPGWSNLIIFAYALAANLPCILVQRYNRLRLTRLLAPQTARSKPHSA